MQIILMRHGEAERLTSTDAERRLTQQGEHQAQQSAAWLLNHGYSIDGLFASPYVRAQQTAAVLGRVLDLPVATCPVITPDDDPRLALGWLDNLELPESAVLALVCHMPVVGRLASYCCEGVLTDGQGFHLAEVQVLDMPILAAGQGRRLAGFVPH